MSQPNSFIKSESHCMESHYCLNYESSKGVPYKSILLLKCYLYFIYQTSHKDSLSYIYEQQHEISNNLVCATSKGSDQPVHTRRLI